MTIYTCVICTQPIPETTIASRHYSPQKPMPPIDKMVCNRKCSDKLRAREGLYERMSKIGKDARGKAVRESNRKKPRRGK